MPDAEPSFILGLGPPIDQKMPSQSRATLPEEVYHKSDAAKA
jgi:hypothetical protein